MNSLLTFRGQVLLSKATAFFILRDFCNACLRCLFLLYFISVNPFAKHKSEQNRLILQDDIILFLMWLQHIATPLFHYVTCYVNHACSMCNANAYIYSLLYLYVSTGVFPFSCQHQCALRHGSC